MVIPETSRALAVVARGARCGLVCHGTYHFALGCRNDKHGIAFTAESIRTAHQNKDRVQFLGVKKKSFNATHKQDGHLMPVYDPEPGRFSKPRGLPDRRVDRSIDPRMSLMNDTRPKGVRAQQVITICGSK